VIKIWCRKCCISLPMRKRSYVGGIIFTTGYCPQCKCKIILVEKEITNIPKVDFSQKGSD